MPKASRVRDVEANLLHRGGVRANEVVARLAELTHETEFAALHVLDAAPREVRRLLAREAGEVAAIDECDARAASCETRCGHRSVDSSADDEHVERPRLEPYDVVSAQRGHRGVDAP